MKLPMRTRIQVIAALAGLVATMGIGLAPAASAACYPGPCGGGDARLDAIEAPASIQKDVRTLVTVDGTNIGGTSDVQTKLKASPVFSNPEKRTVIRPTSVMMFIAAGDSYSVFFRVKVKRGSSVTLTGITKAKPNPPGDVDDSNCCASVTVPVTP